MHRGQDFRSDRFFAVTSVFLLIVHHGHIQQDIKSLNASPVRLALFAEVQQICQKIRDDSLHAFAFPVQPGFTGKFPEHICSQRGVIIVAADFYRFSLALQAFCHRLQHGGRNSVQCVAHHFLSPCGRSALPLCQSGGHGGQKVFHSFETTAKLQTSLPVIEVINGGITHAICFQGQRITGHDFRRDTQQ